MKAAKEPAQILANEGGKAAFPILGTGTALGQMDAGLAQLTIGYIIRMQGTEPR